MAKVWTQFPADLSPVILQVCNMRIAKAAPLFALILAGLRGVLDRVLDAGFTGDYVKICDGVC